MAILGDAMNGGCSAEQVFFMHIPKTGGRTVIRHLGEWFGESIFEVPTNEDVIGVGGWEAKRVVHGHQFYPFRDLIAAQALTLLVFRDPVKRALSAFKYVDRKNDHVLHEKFRARIRSLRDFVMDDEFRFHSVNMQVRMLGSRADLRSLVEEYLSCRLTMGECRDIYSAALQVEADEEMLRVAKGRLSSDRVMFGVTERMPDFIRRVALRLEQEIPPSIYRENVAPANSGSRSGSEQWTTADIEAVIRENQLDSELYAYALDLLTAAERSPGNGQ